MILGLQFSDIKSLWTLFRQFTFESVAYASTVLKEFVDFSQYITILQ